MSAELKALYEEREELIKEVVRLRDLVSGKGATVDASTEEQWQKANEALSQNEKKISIHEGTERYLSQSEETAESARETASQLRRGKTVRPEGVDYRLAMGHRLPTEEQRALAIQGWALYQSGKQLNEAHFSAGRACGVDFNAKEIELRLENSLAYCQRQVEFRAQAVGTDGAGGYTVPTGFVNSLERALLAFGSVRRAARVIRTTSGNDLPMPTVNDTSNKGALIGENTAESEQDVTFGNLTLKAYKYTSKLIRVSAELLQDSAFDMASELGRILGERIGRITEEHFTTGTGTNQPNGVVTASTEGEEAASATAITADEIINLVHSVDLGYRLNGRFMLHDLILAVIRKLKDDYGQYLWQPNLQLGVPPTLYGYGYEINQEMDYGVDASSKLVLFGDFSKYLIRDVATIRLKRLTERYAEYDQEAFVAHTRHDGQLLDAGTHPIKHLITASS